MMTKILTPKHTDLGDFKVLRVLPQQGQQMVGPWIFFDHLIPTEFAAGKGIDVRPHPHINLATVTYLMEGALLHRDSLGTTQAIKPGAINLMVAGKGIVHSERQSDTVKSKPHSLHALQLWLALPKEFEETAPAFYHYPADEIPQKENTRVLIGRTYGMVSPVKTFSETIYVESLLKAGETLNIPDTEECAVYVIDGSITYQSETIPQQTMALIRTGNILKATTDTRLVIIGGAKLSKRYIDWNFVSSRKERIQQAKDDWQQQRFPEVPHDNEEYIPLPS